MKIIYLEKVETWPDDVLNHLIHHHDLFLNWELGKTTGKALEYDNVIYELRSVLRSYALHGYHCSRLTEPEIQKIESEGMQLPSGAILRERIHSLLNAGLIKEHIAERLKSKNQSEDNNRKNMIWFCFYPPHLAGQWGIERFFRSWGGEALYNSHEHDPLTGVILQTIGVPCIIEANVPIANLEIHTYLCDKLIRRFLISRGFQTVECIKHNDRSKSPLLAHNILNVIRYGDPKFAVLTSCDTWAPQLT